MPLETTQSVNPIPQGEALPMSGWSIPPATLIACSRLATAPEIGKMVGDLHTASAEHLRANQAGFAGRLRASLSAKFRALVGS